MSHLAGLYNKRKFPSTVYENHECLSIISEFPPSISPALSSPEARLPSKERVDFCSVRCPTLFLGKGQPRRPARESHQAVRQRGNFVSSIVVVLRFLPPISLALPSANESIENLFRAEAGHACGRRQDYHSKISGWRHTLHMSIALWMFVFSSFRRPQEGRHRQTR